jgi:hypothetical protein
MIMIDSFFVLVKLLFSSGIQKSCKVKSEINFLWFQVTVDLRIGHFSARTCLWFLTVLFHY